MLSTLHLLKSEEQGLMSDPILQMVLSRKVLYIEYFSRVVLINFSFGLFLSSCGSM